MQLKQYQRACLNRLNQYLWALKETQAKVERATSLGIEFDWVSQAWKAVRGDSLYTPRINGLGASIPSVCLKVPTGGGKTLLAIKALDAINTLHRSAQPGMVLWIVPSTQIYNQTLRAMRDRSHPYRQELDMASGGRTLILEKDNLFSPEDIREQLVILLLMLPSANRQNKETLKIFQDRGGFEAFFPPEDQTEGHADLLKRIPNLDTYGTGYGPFSRLVKTSLGNTMRLLSPLIVLDEGHKAYGDIARETLASFNPSFVLELSATPSRESNILANISGQDVLREGMIKLPINVNSRASADWHDALIASHLKRLELEQVAREYENQSGEYIRPICLIQVERTGDKQRLPGFVHAEDVRDYLITKCNVLPEEIAVKSSERDEIENIDLLDPDCQIRYIITKQALQEGWDCPFAYVLATLVNARAPVSMTQLVGRVLRQPYARKTNIPSLDESYVYFCRDRTGRLLDRVYASLREEGLDDVQGAVNIRRGNAPVTDMVEQQILPQFAEYVGKVYLPCFVVPDGSGKFREVGYEIDILSRVDFEKIDLSLFDSLALNPSQTGDTSVAIGLDGVEGPRTVSTAVDLPLDLAFITRQLLEVVPNPWVAYAIAGETIERLSTRYSEGEIRRDLGFVIAELKKTLVKGRDAQAESIFLNLLQTEQLRFWLVAGCAGNAIPSRIRARSGHRLRHSDTDALPARSLFDYPADEFNETEAAVALFIDRQEKILWWFRNTVPGGYSLQGWQPHRVHPDFVALQGVSDTGEAPRQPTVQVLEIKGLHLKNEDTDYKKGLFDLCNRYSQPRPWDEIKQDFSDHNLNFQVVFEDEWGRVLNAVLSADTQMAR